MIPRVHTIDVTLRVGEPFYLTPIFDAHLDDAMCDYRALKKMADERRDLPNHRMIWCGDFCNLVTPPDLKRFRPSVQSDKVARRDDWLNATVEDVIAKIEGLDCKHDLFSPGNHEDSTLKFHGYDITSVVAAHFKAKRGGYSGGIDYKIRIANSTARSLFRVVYHHGAWGGRLAKGYNGAWPFFSQIDGWDAALYGHCHAMRHDKDVRRRVHNGQIEEYLVHLVNCGQWVEAYGEDAGITYYSERAGHMPTPRACPLIKVVPRRFQKYTHGEREQRQFVECTVEV